MTEMSQLEETADRHSRWVAMWRLAVSASRRAMGLVELSTSRFIELSQTAAELLGTTPERGADLTYLSVVERATEAAETFRLARDGMIDGVRSRRRFRRSDGSMVELESSGWVVRSPAGPDLGLWVPGEMHGETEQAPVVEDIVVPPSWHPGSGVDSIRVTLDDHWRMAQIYSNAKTLLGRTPAELLSSSFIELAHPDDVANLLFGFARATTEASTLVRVRLRRHDGSWRRIQVVPTVLEGDGTSPFAVVVVADQESDAPDANSAASGIAGQLRRIADAIEAAGMLAPLVHTAEALGVLATTELSPRQWEVVSRLVRGERVATIAAEMYLSRSTVRNHLSLVYGKFGVHSQAELLVRLRNPAEPLSQ
jgi:PAS domain S-box-containing protein